MQLNQRCLQIVNMIARVQIDTHLINLNVISSRTTWLILQFDHAIDTCGTQLQYETSATAATTPWKWIATAFNHFDHDFVGQSFVLRCHDFGLVCFYELPMVWVHYQNIDMFIG